MRKGIGILAFIIVAVFGLSALVMWLWNFAVVPIFNAPVITYWQAMALLVLSKILLGGFRGGPGGPPWARHKWRSRWHKMTPEERQKFKAEWKQRCGPTKESTEDDALDSDA